MDKITTAIVVAIRSGIHQETETGAGRAYQALEARILERFGEDGELYDAIGRFKKRTGSEPRKAAIQEEAELVQANRQPAVLAAAEALLKNLPADIAEKFGVGATVQGPITAERIDQVSQWNIAGNIYTGKPPQDRDQALKIYCRVVFDTVRRIPMRGVDIDAGDPEQGGGAMLVDQVYVNLNTKTLVSEKGGEDEERRPLSAIEAVNADPAKPRCVVLGDPGSGKTTFANHLCLCLAANGLWPDQNWSARIPGWPDEQWLPVPVILRDFAANVPDKPPKADAKHLWKFVNSRLIAQNLGFASKLLKTALDDGSAVVVLDGLDEIPGGRIGFVRQAISAFAERYPDTRIIVTCRVLSYQDPNRALPGFSVHELAPFDADQIDRFVSAWYAELLRLKSVKTETESANLTRRLQRAVRRPDLWRLAPNPLLLTVMALVHTHKGRLPEARALLYEECVDMLLWRWDQLKSDSGEEEPRMRQLLADAGRTEVDLKRKLWELAYQCHGECGPGEDGEAVADIPESRLIKSLAALHPETSMDWAGRIIETIKYRAGLLIEREPEVYAFPHRTFQEYLAGAHLSVRAGYVKTASELSEQGVFWREAILLSAGRLVYSSGESDRPLALVMELCPEKEADDDAAWRKTWLAGEALAEIGTNRVSESVAGTELLKRVRHRLARLLELGRLRPVERAGAGNVLARLGDPRFDPNRWYLPNDDDLGFVKIPAGKFLMGSDKKRDPDAENDEMPQHELELPEYRIGKYPVTVAQYRVFAEETRRELDDVWREYNTHANHPVVMVSWHDAVAYCEWLTEKLKDRGWEITLPTEAQWEKAARGTDGRIFPYGNNADGNKMNYSETGIHTTSPAGCFPDGESPYGLLDMAGNVREWTTSLSNFDYPYSPGDGREDMASGRIRVLRGGCWIDRGRYCRSAARRRRMPGIRIDNRGFRLVLPAGWE